MSSAMKTFCILEQGNTVNSPLTAKKKALFTTEFSDFYRLNWMHSDDPDAFISAKGIVWSEGRSLLYDKVPKDYDYYIFTDDDIEFSCANGDVAGAIRHTLEEYQPITGTFLDIDRFTNENRRNFIEHQGLEECLSKSAFPISGYDQQVQIYSSDYANVMFPTIYHGSGGSMWYSQWICFQQYPEKQLCLTDVTVTNTRKEAHFNDHNIHHSKIDALVSLFNADLKVGHYDIRVPKIIDNNLSVFKLAPSKSKVNYSLEELSKLYDISNSSFVKRSAIVSKKQEYLSDIQDKLRLINETK